MLCHKCGGSGNMFKCRHKDDKRTTIPFKERFRICCACHGTGSLNAPHSHVLAVRIQREIMDRS